MSKRTASTLDSPSTQGGADAHQFSDPLPAVSSNSKRHRVALACVICRARKIKCDGRKPCKTCTDAKRPARCEYQSATPLRDDEYVRNLEERVRLLSGQIEREQNQPEPRADSVHKLPYGRYGEEDAVGGATENYIDRYTSTGMNQSFSAVQLAPELSSSESRAGSLPRDSVRQESVEDSTLADEQYLTTLASPSISNRNRDSGDSSARTLLHSVEAAIQQLPSRPGFRSRTSYNQSSFAGTLPRTKPRPLPFVWHHSKADLYTLPQRHISDALVNVYRALNYPIFKVLHWPTFMARYEATFSAGEQDPIWLGMLNQIYAIACQIGGRDIVGDDEFEAGHKFHERALALGYPVALCVESLEGLQYLLLMGQYLLSTSQPILCRNVVGHAVRSAQAQALHTLRGPGNTAPLQVELRRRSWAGVIILDATSSAVLGLPPLLPPEGLPHVLPSGAEDDGLQPYDDRAATVSTTSSSLFMRETARLLAIQIQVLATLYNSASVASPRWPDVPSILASARELDRWQAALPVVLQTGTSGNSIRAGKSELELQAHVLHARFLNLKLLIHRPMLFHICQRASSNDLLGDAPSHLDADIARGSMVHCCSAALELLEHVTDSWERGSRIGGAWWFHLYYFHSACLVLLAGLIVEVIASAKSISCLPDVARAIKGVKSAQFYLSGDARESRSILTRLPNGPARSTARNCCTIISGLTAHVLASAPHLQSPQDESQSIHDSTAGANMPSLQGDAEGAGAAVAETADLYQAFLDLFPDVPNLPDYGSLQDLELPSSSMMDPSAFHSSDIAYSEYNQATKGTSAPSTWSIGDLLRAGSGPQPLSTFNMAFDTLYQDSNYALDSNHTQLNEQQGQSGLGIFANYAGA